VSLFAEKTYRKIPVKKHKIFKKRLTKKSKYDILTAGYRKTEIITDNASRDKPLKNARPKGNRGRKTKRKKEKLFSKTA